VIQALWQEWSAESNLNEFYILRGVFPMQLRWIAIGVVCFSAALLSACGGAPSTALASRTDASAMSKSDGRYDASSKDKDDCDESEDHDKSKDKSRSLSTRSKDDDKECEHDDDYDHDSKDHKSSHSLSMSSKSSSKDKDNDRDHDDDDANCKVTVCHVPPGNACNEHKIRVGKSAVRAHIEHGDYLGSCDVPPPPPPAPVCVPSACPAPADPNAMAICNPDGTCGSACIPPLTLVGGVCVSPA
jgi:hypothetical protein